MCSHQINNDKGLGVEHDLEHKVWSRRSFMQAMGIMGSGSLMLGSNMLSASAPSPINAAISNAASDNILILIRLSGGNDGLSTIIPLNQYDLYANARPSIYIQQSKLFNLTNDFGMPTYMNSLESLWGEGQFKGVHGVGMERQSLSHFTGSEIWSNADVTTDGFQGSDTGWMGRHFSSLYPDYLLTPPASPAAIQIGSYGDILFQGEDVNYGFTAVNIDQLERVASSGNQYETGSEFFDECTYDDQLRYLRGVTNTTYQYSGVINEAYVAGNNSIEYQNTDIGREFALIARLIKGNLGTKVFMITLGGFDTHAGQPGAHENLMSDLTIGLRDFYTDLGNTGHDELVLSMTYSEFGRRIYENGSKGTDHGKAAPMLLFGKGLNGSGFMGEHPSLADPTEGGNLEYSIDFRDVYATILGEWLCVPIPLVEQHLLGRPYTPVNLGMNCSGYFDGDTTDGDPTDGDPGTDDPNTDPVAGEETNEVVHKPYYPDDFSTFINITLPSAAHVSVVLYDILGHKLATLYNGMTLSSELNLDVKERTNGILPPGIYIYRIQTGDKAMSKKILLS